MSEDVTLEEVIATALEHRLLDLHTALPCKVQKYHPDRNSVDVIPQIHRMVPTDDGDYVPEALPVLPDVPVAFPRGGGFFVSFPMKPGDFVFVVFSESPIGAWWQTGKAGSPGDVGRHLLSEGVAIPACYPNSKLLSPNTTNLVIGKEGGKEIHITPTGTILLGGQTSFEQFILGTTYRSKQVILDTALTTFITALQAFFTALNADAMTLTPTAPNTVPLATPTATACATMLSAIATFEASASQYLSNVVKGE